jgi:hypothetical protein
MIDASTSHSPFSALPCDSSAAPYSVHIAGRANIPIQCQLLEISAVFERVMRFENDALLAANRWASASPCRGGERYLFHPPIPLKRINHIHAAAFKIAEVAGEQR